MTKQTDASVTFEVKTLDQYFGHLVTTATYSVQDLMLSVRYECDTNLANYINMTNHVYWNLNSNEENIKNHRFELLSSAFAEKDQDDIPTGRQIALNTPFNYSVEDENELFDGSVDHHFFSDQEKTSLKLLCTVLSPQSGIQLKVASTKPGFQLYSGQYLDKPAQPFGGFCVEPQYPPNAINIPEFKAPVTMPQSPYQHSIVYQFSQA